MPLARIARHWLIFGITLDFAIFSLLRIQSNLDWRLRPSELSHPRLIIL